MAQGLSSGLALHTIIEVGPSPGLSRVLFFLLFQGSRFLSLGLWPLAGLRTDGCIVQDE